MASAFIGAFLFCLFIYGIVLAFRASIILGIVTVIISPVAVAFALAHAILKRDLAVEVVEAVKR